MLLLALAGCAAHTVAPVEFHDLGPAPFSLFADPGSVTLQFRGYAQLPGRGTLGAWTCSDPGLRITEMARGEGLSFGLAAPPAQAEGTCQVQLGRREVEVPWRYTTTTVTDGAYWLEPVGAPFVAPEGDVVMTLDWSALRKEAPAGGRVSMALPVVPALAGAPRKARCARPGFEVEVARAGEGRWSLFAHMPPVSAHPGERVATCSFETAAGPVAVHLVAPLPPAP